MNLISEISNIIEHGAFRHLAKDIYNRLEELNNQKEVPKKRCFWELVQNAKVSVVNEKDNFVSIKLKITNNSLIFSHTGNPFTIQDAINLIRPDISKNDDKIKFRNLFYYCLDDIFLATLQIKVQKYYSLLKIQQQMILIFGQKMNILFKT